MATRRRSSPPRVTSVARSLAAAAAALRASEWQRADLTESPDVNTNVNVARQSDQDALRRPDLRYRTPESYQDEININDSEQQQQQLLVMRDRQAFYEELRTRHRHLTQRQRLAREFYEQQQQQDCRTEVGPGPEVGPVVLQDQEDTRQRLGRRSYNRGHAPSSPADAAGRCYRVPAATELVALMVPRAAREISEEIAPVKSTDLREQRAGPTTRSKSASTCVSSQQKNNQDKDKEKDKEPAVVEEAEAEADDESESQKKPKKRVRYLRDTDRRNIIKRIENGEKQAALAREFGVTRAAICHIKKNKFEILSRYNLLVKSAQEMDIAENFAGPPGVEMMVHEVRANSVLLLMTLLRDSRSNGATFRRVAGRLIMILLEEALAIVGTQSVEVITGTGHLYRGLALKDPFCGVAIGAEGFPFLVLFHQMEPEAPQGSIHVEMSMDRRGNQVWHLDHMDLPASIAQHKTMLFSSTCSTGEAECKAIEALRSVGCAETSIMLVVIIAAADGIVKISGCYPHVKIVAGAIDGKVNRHTHSIVPGIGDFVSRYNGA